MAESMDSFSKYLICDKNLSIDAGTCYTHSKMVNVNYTWVISNFSMYQCETQVSSIFSADEDDETKWALSITECPQVLYAKLLLISSTKPEVKGKHKLSIIRADRSKCYMMCSNPLFNLNQQTIDTGSPSTIENYHFHDNAQMMLPKDKLTIFCEMSYLTEIVNISGKKNRTYIPVPDCQIASDYRRLLKSRMLTDITFNVSGKKLPAHKTVLAARSTVFRAMFQNEMAEKINNRVDISDIEYEVFEELLNYIYTGQVDNINKFAEGLVAAAEKYDLDRLKTMSTAILCKTLTVENVSSRLLLADLYRIQPLKDLTLDFINTHTSAVTRTPNFELVAHTHPLLLAEILRASTERRNIVIGETNRKKGIIHYALQLPINFFEVSTLILICWAGVFISQRLCQ